MGDGENRNCQELIAALNEDLAEEYCTISRYATVIALLRIEVANRQQHARFLADTVAALGGLANETVQPTLSTFGPDEMLKRIHRPESETIARYHLRMAQGNHRGNRELRTRFAETGGAEVGGGMPRQRTSPP